MSLGCIALRDQANRVQRVFVARVVDSPDIKLDSEHMEWRWSSFSEAETLLAVPAQRRAVCLARGDSTTAARS